MKIYEAIPAIMSELGAVGKNDTNEIQRYKYRGIDAVMNAVNPLLVKNKVFVIPEVLEQTREERTNAKGTTLIYSICKIKFTFCAEDGSHIEAITIGEGMDTGDKATNKAMAVALKYALFQVFCIPTEEMKQDDPDRETHFVAPRAFMDSNKITAIRNFMIAKGVDESVVIARYGKPLEEFSYEDFTNCMNCLEKSAGKR